MARKEKDILVGSSFGLAQDATKTYFMQIIINENEYEDRDRSDLFVPISYKEAKRLSKTYGIEISYFDYTISIYDSDVINTTLTKVN